MIRARPDKAASILGASLAEIEHEIDEADRRLVRLRVARRRLRAALTALGHHPDPPGPEGDDD